MSPCELPPDPSRLRSAGPIKVPANRWSVAEREFIETAVKYAEMFYDWHLRKETARMKKEIGE